MLNKNYPPHRPCYRLLVFIEIATLILLIIVLWKSQYYKKVLIDLNIIEVADKERPDYWAINGWTNTLQKMHYDADIVFFGNSITCMSDFQPYFPKKRIVELGYPGDTMEGMMRRMDQIRAVSPDKVFLMAGINGLAAMPLDKFEKQYRILLDSIHVAASQASIYVQSILPVNNDMKENLPAPQKIKGANSILKKICEYRKIPYINLHTLYADDNGKMEASFTIDGLHLKPESYGKWADAIRQYIEEQK